MALLMVLNIVEEEMILTLRQAALNLVRARGTHQIQICMVDRGGTTLAGRQLMASISWEVKLLEIR